MWSKPGKKDWIKIIKISRRNNLTGSLLLCTFPL